MNIPIYKTNESKIAKVNFNDIPFGKVFSDHMFEIDFIDGEWKEPKIRALESLSVHPGNLAWHYGQSIFEGMKASVNQDGKAVLFRADQHVERLNASARRMCMPEIPGEIFLEALRKLISLEVNWIPKAEGSALYIRPLMFATDEFIGVRASTKYKFLIMCLPVGPYYPKPVSLKAEEHYVRAVMGGVGEAKTAGNYAASLLPARLANQEGYDQVMWLDAKEFRYVQEVGTMNIFFAFEDRIVTPKTVGTILKGITRASIIEILRNKGYRVEEELVDIHDIIKAHQDGSLKEVFGTGTAAVVANVKKIAYQGKEYDFDVDQYQVAPYAKDMINGIRSGKYQDEFGWTEVLDEVLVNS
jgi:branched-chain amino acid aminotransferase